jgi:NAD(P)-dependent dehydrogenase (short-subunit alcohol dehydrogenase family)
MQRRFEGRSFMVTGAGTGFGAALSVRAAEEGASKVLIHYRNSSAGAERTAERVREIGAEAELIQADITSWEDIKRMAHYAFGEFGGIDVLINNVGEMASGQSSWTEVTEEAIDHVLAVDIKGTMLMVHEFGQRMADGDGGAIVNVGSTVIVRGSPRAPSTRQASTACWESPSPTPRHSVRRCASTPSPRGSWRPRRCWRAPNGWLGGAKLCCPGPRLGRSQSRRR